MFTAKIENNRGQVLTLTQNESEYQVLKVQGLNPTPAQVNLSTMAGVDGALFNSSRLNTKDLVVTLRLNGSNIDRNRQRLYQYFPTGEAVRFYFQNESRDVFIDGYVETLTVDPFSKSEQMQISILCPSSYFADIAVSEDELTKVVAGFEFPFSIETPIPFSELDMSRSVDVYNDSESSTGLEIEVQFLAAVNKLVIENIDTHEAMIFVYAFQAGDALLIDTNSGQKRVKLARNGSVANIFTALQKGSVFLVLRAGDNNFTFSADEGAGEQEVKVIFRHRTVFRGI